MKQRVTMVSKLSMWFTKSKNKGAKKTDKASETRKQQRITKKLNEHIAANGMDKEVVKMAEQLKKNFPLSPKESASKKAEVVKEPEEEPI